MTQAYTLSVSKFNSIVRDIFNNEELLHNIKIVGEVFGVSLSKSSVYFNIKDEEASLPCVCFYGDIMKNVKEGDMVIVTGSPNFYAKSGRFNFVVNKVEPFGLGLLYQRFLELKAKLESEGLFDQSHKKTMPANIKRIGVVTSKDGAVIQDIKNVTWRRNQAIDIVLYNTKVQGNDAEKEIARGIEFFSDYDGVDVVIVARGGGSLEDLAAYNTEIVARATYACNKPIVSAVGHETDFTIIDFVSDLRAPTPSAAAELLTQDTKTSAMALKKDIARVSRALDQYVADKTMQFSNDKNLLVSLAEDFVVDKKIHLDKLASKIANKAESFASENDYALKLKLAHLNKLNPLDILSLGYAKIEQNQKSVSCKNQLDENAEFEIYFADGQVVAKGVGK
ncbi:MAG: exodeoxyribonuclease VII large subunit [Clostridia bacterium]|nr:exodeoxyribonuclease VII large subunit [Clostridia bacterium]